MNLTLGLTIFGVVAFLCGWFGATAWHSRKVQREILDIIDGEFSEPDSDKLCAWCRKPMGTVASEHTSHGICESCAASLMKEVQQPSMRFIGPFGGKK